MSKLVKLIALTGFGILLIYYGIGSGLMMVYFGGVLFGWVCLPFVVREDWRRTRRQIELWRKTKRLEEMEIVP